MGKFFAMCEYVLVSHVYLWEVWPLLSWSPLDTGMVILHDLFQLIEFWSLFQEFQPARKIKLCW